MFADFGCFLSYEMNAVKKVFGLYITIFRFNAPSTLA